MNRDVTMRASVNASGHPTRGVQFGPRVERAGGVIEMPHVGETPQFWGVYVAGRRGGWQWFTDARDEDSARAIAEVLRTADVRAQRVQADTLTVAYVAMGAHDVLKRAQGDTETPRFNPDDWEGELGFVEHVTDAALVVDRVADYFDDHPGVFVYEVAQPFGEEYATALLSEKLWAGEPIIGGAPKADQYAILRDVLLSAQYDEKEVDAALEYVKSH